eukprot:snap_masked-scaffold_6-processed-gene-7.19-mRNA-1 protein AED:1.00 eAED:1.00 QI:0/0/0/0/1/1/2/0/79
MEPINKKKDNRWDFFLFNMFQELENNCSERFGRKLPGTRKGKVIGKWYAFKSHDLGKTMQKQKGSLAIVYEDKLDEFHW